MEGHLSPGVPVPEARGVLTHHGAMAQRVAMLCAALLTASASGAAAPAAPRLARGRSDLALLRLRGGEGSGARIPLRLATEKLCTQPGLVASTGQGGNGFSTLAKHVRGVVFGGMDGILTTFALLAAVEGSTQTSTSLTLVIGISTVLADALSMAAGEYLSAKAEHELQGNGFSADEAGPLEKGAAMFIAFTLFGSLPLIGCVASTNLSRFDSGSSFQISVVITAGMLFALGAIKSQFGAGVWYLAGAEVAGIGGVAATVAYFTARVVGKLMGEEP